MKEYGRNGRLKPEKKKKRKFEVIVNTATQGIYSDFTPMKVAKKVTSELVGKKKQIIFHLREKGKSGKTYGYIGKVRDGKVVVRTHKMSGGEMGCVFNKITPNNFKVDKKDSSNPPKIAITKFCVTRTTIIFFCSDQKPFLVKDDNKYYRFAIYREKNKVFVIELEFSDDKKLEIKEIDMSEIGMDTLSEISNKLDKDPKIASIIKNKIQFEIKKFYKSPVDFFEHQKSERTREEVEANTQLNTIFNNIKPQIRTAARLSPQLSQAFKNISSKNNKQQKIVNDLLNPYICPIGSSSIKEFNISAYGQIFFGFDINLLITQPLPAKLYYKYSYRGEHFYSIENKNGKLDESQPIDMSVIPLYDLLCLYESGKSSNNNLFKSLCDKIRNYKNDYEKQNPGITISFSDDLFTTLDNKSFNKKQERRNTNIGKTKKMDGKKTYYFFGKNTQNPNKYKYACYRDGTEVYYFEIGHIKEQKNLMILQDRSALENLKTFIILRRMKNPQDTGFGKEVYEKASERIGQLKYQEIQKKINPNQSLQSPVQSLVQFPSQTPVQSQQFQVQSPVDPQKSKQSKGIFLKYFESMLSYNQPLPSNKNTQLQPQLPLSSSTRVA
jgi:hypothetical protein